MSHQVNIIRRRLTWLEQTRKELLHLIGEDTLVSEFRVLPTVDPLKFILRIRLYYPLAKASRQPFRDYLRIRAGQADCELPVIKIDGTSVTVEMLIKHRHKEGPNEETDSGAG